MSTYKIIKCPECGAETKTWANPVPTVDIIIRVDNKIVLIKRRNPPYGWALPGGFVDYGERFEDAAIREAKEETGLDVQLVSLLGVYSDPDRDKRQHTVSAVYVADTAIVSKPKAGDDAADIALVIPDKFQGELAFDHEKILRDYVIKFHDT